MSAPDVTKSQSAPLDISELVEREHWVVAGAAEISVVSIGTVVPLIVGVKAGGQRMALVVESRPACVGKNHAKKTDNW
jgi:hypothetical protein